MGRRGLPCDYELTVTPGGVRVRRRENAKAKTAFQQAVELSDIARRRERGYVRPTRGAITKFSDKSRREMRWVLNALEWNDIARLAMVTLTYPREFPVDGRIVRRHRKLFFQRWERKWGEHARGMWSLEFQKRGAPHIHMYVGLPEGALLEWDETVVDEKKVWRWALDTWASIVNSGDARHAQRGVDVRMTSYVSGRENARRVGEYFWRESGKWLQKDVPEGYENVGRFWNYFGMQKREVTAAIDRRSYIVMRRPMRTMRDKLNGTPAKRGVGQGSTMDGLRIYPEDGIGVGTRLLRWAEDIVAEQGL